MSLAYDVLAGTIAGAGFDVLYVTFELRSLLPLGILLKPHGRFGDQ